MTNIKVSYHFRRDKEKYHFYCYFKSLTNHVRDKIVYKTLKQTMCNIQKS